MTFPPNMICLDNANSAMLVYYPPDKGDFD